MSSFYLCIYQHPENNEKSPQNSLVDVVEEGKVPPRMHEVQTKGGNQKRGYGVNETLFLFTIRMSTLRLVSSHFVASWCLL